MTESSENQTPERIDVVFIGAGVSSSYTLLSFLDALRVSPPARTLRTAVLDPSGVYGGLPYGPRSGITSLIITSLKDFLPDPERSLFVDWLSINKAELLAELEAAGGPNTQRWFDDNQVALDANEWSDLYVPRWFFGRYMDDRVRRAIEQATLAGQVEHVFVRDQAVGVRRGLDGYLVSTSSTSQEFSVGRIVLGVGSMPLQPRFENAVAATACLVDDPYTPSLPTTIDRICDVMSRSSNPRVLVLGTNASALEVLYALSDRGVLSRGGSIAHALSPGGVFPERIVEPTIERFVSIPRLTELLDNDHPLTALQIYEAATDDLRAISNAGISVTESLPTTSRAVGTLVARMSRDERLEFAQRWGVELGKQQRRAGGEYSGNVERLLDSGVLVVERGSFVRCVPSPLGVRVEVRAANGEVSTSDSEFVAVVNCAGFASTKSSRTSALINSLIDTGLASPTATGSGLIVNDLLEVAPAIHVMGPMLAGNVVGEMAIWHVEHCGRISSMSSRLGVQVALAIKDDLAASSDSRR